MDFAFDDIDLLIDLAGIERLLIADHIDHLSCGLKPGAVRFHGRNTACLVGGLRDDLGRACKFGGSGAQRDNGIGLRFVFRKAAHPLVEDRGEHIIVVAERGEVMMREFAKRSDCGDILRQIACLSIAERDAFNALL